MTTGGAARTRGGRRTREALAALGPEWVVLHDRRLPARRGRPATDAVLDHVVVGPGGIFVVSAPAWSGALALAGDARQGRLGRRRRPTGVVDAAQGVADLVATKAAHVRPVLCVDGDQDLSGWVRHVLLCAPTDVVEMLASRPRVLDARQVAEAANRLAVLLRPADAPDPAVVVPRRRTFRLVAITVAAPLALTLTPLAVPRLGDLLGGDVTRAPGVACAAEPRGTAAAAAGDRERDGRC